MEITAGREYPLFRKYYVFLFYYLHPYFNNKFELFRLGLSDPENLLFQVDCENGAPGWKHQHFRVCDKCEVLPILFGDLRAVLEEREEMSKGDKKMMKEIAILRRDYHEWENKIMNLKAHQLRTAKSEADKQKIIGGLQVKFRSMRSEKCYVYLQEHDALITADWAMKHMPLYARESTVDWYGQRGMPWHVTHVTTVEGEDFFQHNLVHILEGDRQVRLEILTDFDFVSPGLGRRHCYFPPCTAGTQAARNQACLAAVRSSGYVCNAKATVSNILCTTGCYKSAATLASIRPIADDIGGIEVVGYYYSEAQSGKGPPDLTSARVKRKTRSAADAGTNVRFTSYEACDLCFPRGLANNFIPYL